MSEQAGAAWRAAELARFAAALFEAAGLDRDKAVTVGEVLLEGDLLGHTTHGLALAAPYLEALAEGSMRAQGAATVVSDKGGALCWDGHRLPGPWLVTQAIEAALARVGEHWHRRGRDPREPPHRLPCLLSRARDRQGLHDPAHLLRPVGAQRRAVRRAAGAVHAGPDRGRHPDRGASRS